MSRLTKNKLFIFSLTFILLISFTACEKNPTNKKDDQAPPLPPVESMQPNVTFFSNPQNQSLSKTALSKNNFFAAGARVLIINSVVLVASIVPTAIFLAALSQTPELQADGKFHWIYTIHYGGNTYSADLAGSIDKPNSEVIWEMYVTCTSYNPPLDRFLWYDGRAKIGNKEGWWMFHHDQHPDSRVDVLKIEWQVPDSTQQNLTITNVYTDDSNYGDNLKYQFQNNEGNLIFYDASETQTSTIHWNTQLGSGYIQWFDYKNGVKNCWDENQDDVDCPPFQ